MDKIKYILDMMYEVMYDIDIFLDHKVFSEEKMLDEKTHYQNALTSLNRLNQIADHFKTCSYNDSELSTIILDLESTIASLEQYFDRAHDHVRNLITQYPYTYMRSMSAKNDACS